MTSIPPVIVANRATDMPDAYAAPGDPLAYMLPTCQLGVHVLIDKLPDLKPLEPIQIEITGKVIS